MEETNEEIVLCPVCKGRKKYAIIDSKNSNGRETFYTSRDCYNCKSLGIVLQTTIVKQVALTSGEFDKLPISGKYFIEYEDWIKSRKKH